MLRLLIREALLAERSRWPEASRPAQAAGFAPLHSSNFHAGCQVRFFFLQLISWLGNLEKRTAWSPSLQDRSLLPHSRHPAHRRCPGQSALDTGPERETCPAGPCSWDRCLTKLGSDSTEFMAEFI